MATERARFSPPWRSSFWHLTVKKVPRSGRAATTKEQAAIVFNSTVKMVKASPELSEIIRYYKSTKRLVVHETNSIFGPLSSDENTGDGLNVYAAIIDELHAHKSRGMWDVLDTATGKRLQALILAITTAGVNQDGICYEIRGMCIDILKADYGR